MPRFSPVVSKRQDMLRLLRTNIARARRFRLLRFRLITFGLYEPSALYGWRVFTHPWWQVNPRVAWLLLRHTPSYGRWLAEIEATAQCGALGWWEQRAGSEGATHLQAWIDVENSRG